MITTWVATKSLKSKVHDVLAVHGELMVKPPRQADSALDNESANETFSAWPAFASASVRRQAGESHLWIGWYQVKAVFPL